MFNESPTSMRKDFINKKRIGFVLDTTRAFSRFQFGTKQKIVRSFLSQRPPSVPPSFLEMETLVLLLVFAPTFLAPNQPPTG